MSDEERIIRDSKLTPRFEWNSRDGVTFDAGRTVLQTYTLELIGLPREADPTQYVALTQTWLREAEENLTDLLPPGFSVVIREWDEEEK